jgi:hypothetical protein
LIICGGCKFNLLCELEIIPLFDVGRGGELANAAGGI